MLNELPSPPSDKIGWPWTEESQRLPEAMPDGIPWPRISIVTPSYNQGRFLEETIRSALLQGYPNLEYIIIDGGSTDESVKIIQRYERWLTFWVSEPDKSQSHAIKKGIDRSTGKIVNWINSDDLLLKDGLFKVARLYVETQRKDLVICGAAARIDERSNVIRYSYPEPVRDKILPMAPPIQGGVQASWFISKELWNKIGGIDITLGTTMDTDLYFRANIAGANFSLLKDPIAALREHYNTKTFKGWRKSIGFKRRFYYGWLDRIPEEAEKKIYKKKIKQNISGYYLQTITSKDNLFRKIYKIFLSIKENPLGLVSLNRIKRILLLLFVNKQI